MLMKTMKQVLLAVAIVVMLCVTLMVMTGKFNPLSHGKVDTQPVVTNEVAETVEAAPEVERFVAMDPAKEARDLQLIEMGFDPAAGHKVSVNYTSSVSQTNNK